VAGGGAEFTVITCVGLFVGQWFDRRLGTGPWLLIIGAFAGAAAGFYRLVRVLIPAKRGGPAGSGRSGLRSTSRKDGPPGGAGGQ
jgi:F0F1-type ATP synthase assembly protein I